MGICTDKSIGFLADKGYNVVRLPSTGLKPLTLLGRQNGETMVLGPLDALITNPPGPLPAVGDDEFSAELSGKTSSKLALGIGINVLGNLIGAMGGTLGAKVNFSSAKTVEFTYFNVKLNAVMPILIGRYLSDATVDAHNLLLREYVLGKGELYVITRTAKSNSFSVTFGDSKGGGVAVEVPVIQETIGGDIKVEGEGTKSSTIKFTGPAELIFAFQCFQIGVVDGELSLTSVKAGTVSAAPLTGEPVPPPLDAPAQLLSVRI